MDLPPFLVHPVSFLDWANLAKKLSLWLDQGTGSRPDIQAGKNPFLIFCLTNVIIFCHLLAGSTLPLG